PLLRLASSCAAEPFKSRVVDDLLLLIDSTTALVLSLNASVVSVCCVSNVDCCFSICLPVSFTMASEVFCNPEIVVLYDLRIDSRESSICPETTRIWLSTRSEEHTSELQSR